MWECRHAELQLAAPATTQSGLSQTWLSSLFIASCPGLTSFGGAGEGGEEGGEEGAATAAGGLLYQTPLVIDLEKCMSFTWGGGVWHQRAFENVG